MKTTITIIATTPDDATGVADAIAHALDNPDNYPDDVDTSDWSVYVSTGTSAES